MHQDNTNEAEKSLNAKFFAILSKITFNFIFISSSDYSGAHVIIQRYLQLLAHLYRNES
jgi:hypothetical protein